MGYTTEFDGEISIDPPLNPYEINYLKDFSETRRMHRSEGPLFVNVDGNFGQSKTEGIIDYNSPDPDQPGLWNQWVPDRYGESLEWNGAEKFYYGAEWMKYLVENLLAPTAREYLAAHVSEDYRLVHFTADHVLNGEITAQGEDTDDKWILKVEDNVVKVAKAEVTYSDFEPI